MLTVYSKFHCASFGGSRNHKGSQRTSFSDQSLICIRLFNLLSSAEPIRLAVNRPILCVLVA